MACIINYNNKTYSLEDFKNILLKDLSLVKEVANKSQERLKAIQEVFNNNPELSKIGDVFSYAIYLDTIFPDSKVRDIVYHGTDNENKIEFKKERQGYTDYGFHGKGFYFAKFKEYAQKYGNKTYSILLNITNPEEWRRELQGDYEIYDNTKSSDGIIVKDDNFSEYVVNENNQIHILGSKKDIQEFKEFINTNKTFESRNIFEKVDVAITPDNMVEESDEKHYSVIEQGKKFLIRRVSSFLEDYISGYKKKNESVATTMAKKIFKNKRLSLTDKIVVDSTLPEMTFDEYVEYREKNMEQNRLRGKVIHAYIEYYTKRTTETENVYKQYLDEYTKSGGKDKFVYLSFEYVKGLFNKLGIDLDSAHADKVSSEFSIYSDEVMLDNEAMGGTIDLIIKHFNGTYSIVDFKTGFMNEKYYTTFKYTDIPQTDFNKASMQLASYAMLLKNKYPNIKFRNVQVAKINPIDGKIFVKDVELNRFVQALKGIFLVLNPNFVRNNEWLFNYKDYYGISRDLMQTINETYGDNVNNLNISTERLLQILESRLHTIYTENSVGFIENDKKLSREVESIIKQIGDLEGREFGDVLEMVSDMGIVERLTSPGFNVKAPILKLFRKLYERAKLKFFGRMKTIREELYGKLDDVLLEYYKNNNVLGSIVSKSEFLKKYLNFVDYNKLFEFAWKETEFGKYGVTEFDFANSTLTNVQKEYLLALHTQIRNNYFVTLATEEGIDYYKTRLNNYKTDPLATYLGEAEAKAFLEKQLAFIQSYPPSKKGDKQNPGFRYYDGFVPRVPKTFEEKDLIEKAQSVKYSITDYFSTTHASSLDSTDKKTVFGVPLKYFGEEHQIDTENYSTNISLAGMAFIENLVYKQEMDGVNVIGKGAANIIANIKDSNNNPTFENNLKWLRTYIKNNIELHAEESKEFNSDGKINKAARALALYASLTKYALVPASIFKNLIIENMFNLLKATAGSLSKRGLGNWHGTITLSDLLKGYGEYMIYIKDSLTNNLDNNKLHHLDLQFNTMYSSTEFVLGENSDPSLKNRGLGLKTLFAVNNMVEEFALATIKIAAMNALKHPETGESMYDLYNNKGEYIGKTRGILQNGTKVDGFTEQEIVAINKIASTAHGEYDPTMRNELSGVVGGVLLVQFHKYLWNTFERAWQGRFENASIGQLQIVKNSKGQIESVDMLPVLEWGSQNNLGTGRASIGFIKAYMNSILIAVGLENDRKTGKQYWEGLSDIEKEGVKFVMLQVLSAIAMSTLSIAMFGSVGTDSDKDKFKKMLLNMQRDMWSEFNLPDIINTASKPFISLEVLKQLYMGIDNFIFKGGIIGKTDRKGNVYGSQQILKNVPGTAQYLNTETYLESEILE